MSNLPKVILQRKKYNPRETLGEMIFNGQHLCYTLEDPWKNNQSNISCIPEGSYRVYKYSGTKYKNVWRVHTEDIGRYAVLIHWGNTHVNTEGCILVGNRVGKIFAKKTQQMENAVLASIPTIEKLRGILPDEFTLEIRAPE